MTRCNCFRRARIASSGHSAIVLVGDFARAGLDDPPACLFFLILLILVDFINGEGERTRINDTGFEPITTQQNRVDYQPQTLARAYIVGRGSSRRVLIDDLQEG